MNDYLSQIAVRARGAITPHSLAPVQPGGMFTPRSPDTGNELTGPLVPPATASPLKRGSGDIPLPEQPLPVQQQKPATVPEQQVQVHNRVLYLERFLERPAARVQANSTSTVTNSKPAAAEPAVMSNMQAATRETANTGGMNDPVKPVIRPQQEPDVGRPSQIFALRPDTSEKELVQHLQPATSQKDVTVRQPTPVKASQQTVTVLAPRNGKAPAPQAKKTALPKVTIGRITVEVVPPPAGPVQTVPRNKQRSAGSPIPAPGSDEIHKLSFGFGQL